MQKPSDYAVSQKVIHWVMAALIMLDLVVAKKFGNPMELADRLESRGDHASLGIIVAVLFLIRIALRLKHGAPSMPAGMTKWQTRAAHWGHGLLYALMALLIVSGVATAINAAYPITVFDTWDITLGRESETLFDQIRVVHELATNTIIMLIIIHIAAALYHYWFVKDNILQRMLKFWKTY